jgi:hypothetical protein
MRKLQSEGVHGVRRVSRSCSRRRRSGRRSEVSTCTFDAGFHVTGPTPRLAKTRYILPPRCVVCGCSRVFGGPRVAPSRRDQVCPTRLRCRGRHRPDPAPPAARRRAMPVRCPYGGAPLRLLASPRHSAVLASTSGSSSRDEISSLRNERPRWVSTVFLSDDQLLGDLAVGADRRGELDHAALAVRRRVAPGVLGGPQPDADPCELRACPALQGSGAAGAASASPSSRGSRAARRCPVARNVAPDLERAIFRMRVLPGLTPGGTE